MTEIHAPEPDKQQLRPTALMPEDAARLLTSLGGKTVTVETILAVTQILVDFDVTHISWDDAYGAGGDLVVEERT